MAMTEVRLREKGQVTIPAEIIQEWGYKNQVHTNDSVDAILTNGVVILIPKNRHHAKRDLMSFAGIGKGVWGKTPEEIDQTIQEIRDSWAS
jgi:bifunctional DNA-binding transcriptional regulator/antitoxin component of YhaV-PrlF toxin-antitoxin module